MARHAEFWLLRVYCGTSALGNATGVVFGADGRFEEIAAALGCPDTVFLSPAGDGAWDLRAYSPSEELSFCTQGLIAAHRVLERKTGADETRFRTLAGETTVASEGAELAWVEGRFCFPQRRLSIKLEGEALRDALIDTGRTRLYRELPDAGALDGVRYDPDAVLAYCRSEGISGVCLVARTGERVAALRVFTTSLDGREDASTGGAAMGVAPFFGEPGEWRIEQGSGAPHQRGLLFVKQIPGSEIVRVGGAHRFVAQGELL